MPTPNNNSARPIGPFSDRTLYSECAELVEEAVRYGSHLLDRCVREKTGLGSLSIILLFRHSLESADGIQVLLKDHNAQSAKHQTRGLLECLFYLKYLLQVDSNKRSLSYLFFDINHKIKLLKRQDPSTVVYKEFMALRGRDEFMGTPIDINTDGLAEKISGHEALLKLDTFDEQRAEYEQMFEKRKQARKEHKHSPALTWYGMFGGPDGLADLCKKINMWPTYEFFYRRYSGTIHPDHLSDDSLVSTNGRIVRPLRIPGNPSEIAGVASEMCYRIFKLIK
jgi:hypothetical protein